MENKVINFADKFSLFTEHWSPKIIAQMNDYHIKLAKVEGDFVWHDHKDTDELFIVIEGELRIDFRDSFVTIKAGELFVVPKGVEHKTSASSECKILFMDPVNTTNTGDIESDKTATDEWI